MLKRFLLPLLLLFTTISLYAQSQLLREKVLRPFPVEDRTDSWYINLSPLQSARYTIDVVAAQSGYVYESSSLAWATNNLDTFLWTVTQVNPPPSGMAARYHADVLNTEWLSGSAGFKVRCTWVPVISEGEGDGEGDAPDPIHGWAEGQAAALSANLWIETSTNAVCLADSQFEAWSWLEHQGSNRLVRSNWVLEPPDNGTVQPSLNTFHVWITPSLPGELSVRATTARGQPPTVAEIDMPVIKVDIEQTNVFHCAGSANEVTFNLTGDSYLGNGGTAIWTGGPDNEHLGTHPLEVPLTFTVPTNWPAGVEHTITARSTLLTNCYDTATLSVVKVELVVPDAPLADNFTKSNAVQLVVSPPGVEAPITVQQIWNEPIGESPRNAIGHRDMTFIEDDDTPLTWHIEKAIWFGTECGTNVLGYPYAFFKDIASFSGGTKVLAQHFVTVEVQIGGCSMSITNTLEVTLTDGDPLRSRQALGGFPQAEKIRNMWGYHTGWRIQMPDVLFTKTNPVDYRGAVSQYKEMLTLEEYAHENVWYGYDFYGIGWTPDLHHGDITGTCSYLRQVYIDKFVAEGAFWYEDNQEIIYNSKDDFHFIQSAAEIAVSKAIQLVTRERHPREEKDVKEFVGFGEAYGYEHTYMLPPYSYLADPGWPEWPPLDAPSD